VKFMRDAGINAEQAGLIARKRSPMAHSRLPTEQTGPWRTDRLSAYNRSLSMPTFSSRADPSAVADGSANPAVTPVPNPEDQRLSSLGILQRLKMFTVRLKSNGKWMKQFLHGGK
jgi:hypothetical protein